MRRVFFTGLAVTLSPLLALFIAWRRYVKKRPITGSDDKWWGNAPHRQDQPVLLHGVSLGEVNLLGPVLERLADKTIPTLVSTGTSTGQAAVVKKYPADQGTLFPFDLPWAVRNFLNKTKPRAVLLFELEVWPLFLSACFARDIPVAIINGRLSDKSFRGYQRCQLLLGPLFKNLRLVCAQNQTWADRFTALGAPRVIVSGSLKADMVRVANHQACETETVRLGLQTDERILLGASTGTDEELAIIKAWESEAQQHGWRLILCPRHPERGNDIAALCQSRGHSVSRSSEGTNAPGKDSIIIVDEIGRLAALYGMADIAIVGGSLGSNRGGQNMLEAAAAGCCTVVGMDTRNQVDGMTLLRAHNGVIESEPEQLSEAIKPVLADPALRQSYGKRAQQAWQHGCGAIDGVDAAIQEWILD